ncbi:hypothetical protein H0A65_16785 [Alcaligenaceae bacterium]|nr:hypothetical protein [Alcaligenaceae bacterium]
MRNLTKYQSLLLFSVALAGTAPCLASEFSTVSMVEGHFEYTKDGAGTLGIIASDVEMKGKVMFRTCKNKTVEVLRAYLRPSEAKCDIRPYVPPGPLPVGLAPIYKWEGDASNTKVSIQGKEIDLTKIEGWPTTGVSLRDGSPREPVGYVFTDSERSKAIVILEDELKTNQ